MTCRVPAVVLILSFLCFNAAALEERNWSRVWGSTGEDSKETDPVGVAVDAKGNSYVVGMASGDVNAQSNPGVECACITSYDASGTHRWTSLRGPSGSYAQANDVTIGPDGNIYVTGQTWGGMDGQQEVGNGDFFVLKYTPAGVWQWTRIWGSIKLDSGKGITLDSQGNIYVAGTARESIGGQPHTDRDDLCLTKLDSEGGIEWVRLWGGVNAAVGYESAEAVALDDQTNIYVVGFSDTSVDGATFAGSFDVVLTRFKANGDKDWTSMWGASGIQKGYGVAVDSQNMVYVSGYGGSFGGETSAGDTDPFLMQVNGAGSSQWLQMWGSTQGDFGFGVDTDRNGLLYVTGVAPYGYTFDGQGGYDGGAYLTCFTSAGTKLWTERWGAPSTQGRNVFCVDTSVVYVAGATYGTFDDETGDGDWDLWVSRWGPAAPPAVITHYALYDGGFPLQIVTDASGDVDRVELTVNGELVGICYGGDYAWDLVPDDSPLVMGSNTITATAYRPDGTVGMVSAGSWIMTQTGMATQVIIEDPGRGFVFDTIGTTAPSTNILLRVRAAKQISRVLAGGTLALDWGSVTNVRFYMNGNHIHTSTNSVPAAIGRRLYHEYEYDITGLSTGIYRFVATFTPPDGYNVSSDYRSFRIQQRTADLVATRDVSFNASSNCFVVDLTIRNYGSGSAYVNRITETAQGFQICRVDSPWPGSSVSNSAFAWDTRSSSFVLNCGPLDSVAAGEAETITYYAVPILFPGGGDYVIGGGGALEGLEPITLDPITLPMRHIETTVGPFASRIAFEDAVIHAKRCADYLLVTCPATLADVYGTEGAGNVLQKMAELATYRQGVLGYFQAANWVRSAFRSGDPFALGYVFNEWEQSDQAWIGDVNDNRIRSYSHFEQVVNDDIPIPFTADIRSGDDLAVGNLLQWTSTGLSWHGREEIAWALGDGHSTGSGNVEIFKFRHVNSEAVFSSFTISGTHYASGGAILIGLFVPGADNVQLAVLAPEGDITHYTCYDSGASWRNNYPTAFERGDLVAAGNVMDDELDEIVIGDLSADRIRVYGREPSDGAPYPAYIERLDRSVTLAAGDGLAVGDVIGDARAEVIVADASANRIRVYEYQSSGSRLNHVVSLDWDFDPGDHLDAGRIGTLLRDQIIVVRGTAHDGVDAGVIEMFRPADGEVPGDRYALDALINRSGEWTRQLHPHWADEGHLLLVGETEILPGFYSEWRVYYNATYRNWHVDYHDRNYADNEGSVDKPELAMGRIIGNTAEALVHPMQTSIDIARGDEDFAPDSALCVAGDEDGDRFRSVRNRISNKLVDRGFSSDRINNVGPVADVLAWADDRDAIFFSGHGNWKLWDGIGTDDIDAHFSTGTGRPLVFACSCSTGRYHPGYSFGEAFLAGGAAAYIGALTTTYSYKDRGWSPRFAEAFFDRIREEYTLGESLKHCKRYRMSDSANTYSWDWNLNRYHCATYQFYGDPKLAYNWPTPLAALSAKPPEPLAANHFTGPMSVLDLDLPMIDVESTNGVDFVTLPDQGEVCLEGTPAVPIYTATVTFPSNCIVQDVTLDTRKGETSLQGLNPPIVAMFSNAIPAAVSPSSTPGPEWWPDRDYDWSVEEEAGGTSVLYVTAYPFYHNTNTGASLYYSNYTFAIGYAWSSVDIRDVVTEDPAYTNGELLVAQVSLVGTNPQPLDVTLQPRVVCDADGTTTQLTPRILRDLRGRATCRLTWDVDVAQPGDYLLEVTAVDNTQQILDRGAARFAVGSPGVSLRDFFMNPPAFGLGDNVALGVTLDNTGTLPLDGSIYVLVQDGAGATVELFRHDFTALGAGQSEPFQPTWVQASLLPRNCRIIVYAVYGGSMTSLQVAADGSTDPLVVESIGLARGECVLSWASMAGCEYSVQRAEDLAQAFSNIATHVTADPPYNEYQHTIPGSHGFYRIVETDTLGP